MKCAKLAQTSFELTCFKCAFLQFLGQLEIEAPDWMSIVEISYRAWTSLPPRVFQAAWISCGYVTSEDLPIHQTEPPISMEDARQVLDVFGKLGGGTPQRCTCFEWQIQDCTIPVCKFRIYYAYTY